MTANLSRAARCLAFATFGGLLIWTVGATSHAQVRFYFGDAVGLPPPGDGIPEFAGLPGEEFDLRIWAKLGPESSYVNGYSLDVYATDPGVIEGVSSQIHDPVLFFRIGGIDYPSGFTRWSRGGGASMVQAPQANTQGALFYGGHAFDIFGRGIDKTQATPQGPPVTADPLYSSVGDSFLVQTLRVRILAGIAERSTGIALHVGHIGMAVDGATSPVPIYLGAGSTSVRSTSIGETDGSVHAKVYVPSLPRTDIIFFGGDPFGALTLPFTQGVSYNEVTLNVPAGRLLIDRAYRNNGAFDVYFDLEFEADANVDLAGVVALLNDAGVDAAASPTLYELGSATDYDLRVRAIHAPDENLVVNFDFTGAGIVGVNVLGAGVSVPEPTSFVLVCAGTAAAFAASRSTGARRRATLLASQS